ncbi:Serine/threonine-protein kinase [Coemansia sp. RSA 2705]|nr:Serine/threonine-protein kinase [Coemansia sp. RSA 2705]
MLESNPDTLRSRLEFSLNLDMLDAKQGQLEVKPRRRTLRRLLNSGQAGTLRIHRHSRSIRRPTAHAAAPSQRDTVGFQLQQLKLPSPITSFSPDMNWMDKKKESDNDDDDDDDVALAELVPQVKAPSLNESTEPQRGRSLMFKPLLDVTAVGTLIDTISQNEPPRESVKAKEQAEPSKPKEPQPASRILGSLRRATRTRTMVRLRRRRGSQRVRSMIATATGRNRPGSHDICPIETVQDEQQQQRILPTIQPGFQAAAAMVQPKDETEKEEEDIRGFAPIAMSLQGAKDRQFLLNTPLGEFEVERTLGQGSYGKVKLMRSALSNEHYAVKIIRRHTGRRSGDKRKAATLDRRVVREANLAAILGQLHPHIVPLHDLRATDTHFYLFYAFVQGQTLAERVGASGMGERDARALFKCVAETLQFCHQYSVIHRDIKLENVLIDQRGRVMLIDFGLANFFGGGSALMDTFCGSLPYTAPEILRGTAYTGPEVDVWSLGVLLYVMLTGRFPFDDPAQPANFERIMAGDFPLRGSLSRAVQELLVRMLEPDATRRVALPDVLAHAWLADPAGPAPGTCCLLHNTGAAPPAAVHTRRTLVLPGPRASRLIAREVSTCLDRPLAEVIAHIDRALSRGSPAPSRRDNSGGSCWNLLAPIEQWPAPLHGLGGGPLVEVANSPIVSVYALVLQQIGMRRYYLDLPPLEPGLASTTRSSSSRLAPLLPPAPAPAQPAMHAQPEPEPAEPPRSLAARLAAQLTSRLSLLGSGGSANGGSNNKPGLRGLADHVIAPAYVQPLAEPPISSPALRTIGALEHLHERIVLPAELSTAPALRVLAQLSALLQMHEIAHTFVETKQLSAQQAMLNSSMFSLKSMAALASSHDALDAQLAQVPDTSETHPQQMHVRSSLKSLLSVFGRAPNVAAHNQSTPVLATTNSNSRARPRIVHPHLRDDSPPPAQSHSNAPDVVTTVPVKHPTAVVLAQYSPSLHRGRETEVVEYYSCAVRIELVRMSAHLRPRYALLVDRMTGHRGKYALFRMFLHRIVAALPAIQPADISQPCII